MTRSIKGSVGPIILPEELVEHHAQAGPRDSFGGRRNTLVSFIAGSVSLMPKVPTTSGEFKNSEKNLGDDLKDIALKEVLYIRQLQQEAEKYINVRNKYYVEDKKGRLMYQVVETTEAVTRRLFRREQPFYLKMLNKKQECVLDFVGDPGLGGLGAYVKVQRNSNILGKVKQISPFFACCNFSPSYKVVTEDNKTLFKIVWPRGRLKSCVSTNDFQIFSSSEKFCARSLAVGKISRENKFTSSENKAFEADTYALVLQDNEMDRMDKALLVAAVIMLDFQFFEGRKASDVRSICICILLLILVILLVAIITVIVIFSM
ncbi:unnamed protein product [Orchesella dallaii]|uniref:Phospholipid scramblase n=1 Tax=Orchesella dallaii TaxID=48710 RepID=A0ABP1RIZ7_9HEXA